MQLLASPFSDLCVVCVTMAVIVIVVVVVIAVIRVELVVLVRASARVVGDHTATIIFVFVVAHASNVTRAR